MNDYTLFTGPATAEEIFAAFEKARDKSILAIEEKCYEKPNPEEIEIFWFGGIRVPIVTSPYLDSTEDVWIPPANDRFVTYEPKDWGWLKALGFGHWEKRRAVYLVGKDARYSAVMKNYCD